MPDDCLECTSMLCENNKHALDIQLLHDDIKSACIDASEDIPSIRKSSKMYLVGMNVLGQKKKKPFSGENFG